MFTTDDADLAGRLHGLGRVERSEATHTIRGEGRDFVTDEPRPDGAFRGTDRSGGSVPDARLVRFVLGAGAAASSGAGLSLGVKL